ARHQVFLGIDAGAAFQAHAELIEVVLVSWREEMSVAARNRQPEIFRLALDTLQQTLELEAATAVRVHVMVPFDIVEPDNAHAFLLGVDWLASRLPMCCSIYIIATP